MRTLAVSARHTVPTHSRTSAASRCAATPSARAPQQQQPSPARSTLIIRVSAAAHVMAAPTPTARDVFNFSAGPAMLPMEVLAEAQRDTLDYGGTGMSVMEMSHRSKAFEGIIKNAEADLRTLLGVPDNYRVMFLQGGASTQFASIPLNFTAEGARVCAPGPAAVTPPP